MWIWIAFLIGQLLHTLKRYNLITSSPKEPNISSLVPFARVYWLEIGIRVATGVGVLLVWKDTRVASSVWALIGEVAPIDLSAVPLFPITPGVALLFGLFWDSLMDWVMEKYQFLRGK